jgi:hypothetical protein
MQAMNLDEDDSLIKDSPTADCSRGRESMKCFQSVQLEKTKRNFGNPEEEGDGYCEIIQQTLFLYCKTFSSKIKSPF